MEWNLIENGLPPVGVPLIVTFRNKMMSRNEITFANYQKGLKLGNWGFFSDEGFMDPEYDEVIAWMEIPAPYES